MLSIQLKNLFALRGIRHPYGWLVKNGMPVVAARHFAAGTYRHAPLQHLEKLCLLLRCTPNEIFAWQPAPGTDATHQPLSALIPTPADRESLLEVLDSLSIEELRKLGEKIKQEKEKEG